MKNAILIICALWLLAFPGCSDDKPLRIDAQKRPQIVKHVDPIYPEEAFKQRIQGVVKLEVTINASGDVIGVKVIPAQPPQPLLEQSAAAAVRQWKYKPYTIGGKAKAVIFTAAVTFAQQDEKLPPQPDDKRPKKIKTVRPQYPEEAVRKRIQGVVRIEATIDKKGDVVEAKVLLSENPQPLLEEAALTAVKQWKYEPYLVEGKARGVVFTVTVTFALQEDKVKERPAPRR